MLWVNMFQHQDKLNAFPEDKGSNGFKEHNYWC
jgi:hypothetical protein